MDIEFHYYMTYLIAARAGFSSTEASIIAFSAQFVDDNNESFAVDKGRNTAFKGQMSQTMNIFKPEDDQLEIYPPFHFIPGEKNAETAKRKDGTVHDFNTTPNSKNAQEVFKFALNTENLYHIGIACHGYVDTWAHQNFVGCSDKFNDIEDPSFVRNLVKGILLNTGHADAEHNPDWPALIWVDPRLVNDTVNNKERFLDAAKHLFEYFFKTSMTNNNENYDTECTTLIDDLSSAIGKNDNKNTEKENRIKRYKALALQPEYGGTELEEYKEYEENEKHKVKWFQEAVHREPRSRRGGQERTVNRHASAAYNYFWKNPDNHTETDWYKFQMAAKSYQQKTLSYLKVSVIGFLDAKESISVVKEKSSLS